MLADLGPGELIDREAVAARRRERADGAMRNLERPTPLPSSRLELIHGLADDNVVVAHSLRLSRALLEAGKPHQVLPLSGITHMATQEVVAENLLLLQLDFLRCALRLAQ